MALPTDKAGAIVLEGSEEDPAHLPGNLAAGDGDGQATQILVTIDKSLLVRVQFFPPDTHWIFLLPRCLVTPVAALTLAIQQLANGESLDQESSVAAFGAIMRGEASPVQVAALLMGLRTKGETAAEVAGAALALRCAMTRLDTDDPDVLVDTCGTGGGRVGTLNVSTAAAFVAAGAGVPVAKHGNRSYTSRCGSADVLEALGVDIDLQPAAAARVLDSAGLTFLYAPTYHPAMRHVAPVRKELGVPTIMNMLGPLANPGGVLRQVVGVSDGSRAELMAEALSVLGTRHALVVHGSVGMDEISPMGSTFVWEVEHGDVRTWELDPAVYELDCPELDGLGGGNPAENAERIERLLQGKESRVVRCAVLLNAAAALYVSRNDWSFEDAAARATTSLDTGAAARVLANLRKAAPRR